MQVPTKPNARLARIIIGALIAFFFGAILQVAILLPDVGTSGDLVDFDAYYIVGQMFWDGRIAEAYNSATMAAIQHEFVGHDGFMPWTYPPQFNLVVLIFPALSRGIAYALFTGFTLAGYLYIIFLLACHRNISPGCSSRLHHRFMSRPPLGKTRF